MKERVVSLHPVPVSSEHARRLQVEVERLSKLSKVEWMYYVESEGYAEKYGTNKVALRRMVEAVIKEHEKKERAEKAEQRRIKDRAEKKRVAKEREEGRLDRQAKKDADRKAEKRDRERQRELAAIAKLPKAEHAVKLAQLARRLGEDLEALHAELELLLADAAAAVAREAAEPWPEPVSTKELLDESLAQIRRYVVIHDDNAATIYALAVLFAWCHDEVATYSPLFLVQGADIDAAKSTLCQIHKLLTPRGYMIGKPTGPVIYRYVDHRHPSLYIDNVDKWLAKDRDAANVIDISWMRGTTIPRTVDGVVRDFDPFCFKMLNGVDVLPHLDPSTRSRCLSPRCYRSCRARRSSPSRKLLATSASLSCGAKRCVGSPIM